MHDICHVEIPSTDFAKSKKFYETVFGWKVNILEEMNYATWEGPEGPGGGFKAVEEPCTCKEGCCLVYIHVQSIDEKAKEAEKAGGQIITPKTPVSDFGWFAIFQDPAGGAVALWERGKDG